MEHISILITIIISTGLFGGIVNYFRNNLKEDFNTFRLLRSVALGLAASILVPLLLKMISSNLLETSKTDAHDYFVIAGLCVISAIFATNFIDSIGKNILKQIGDVKDDLENVKSDVDASTNEPEIRVTKEVTEKDSLNENEKQILCAIYASKYTYRSITGISKELGENKEIVRSNLYKLVENNLVIVVKRKNEIRWKISEKGIELAANFFNNESSIST
jgi:DNA-binding MarR family transcriptional regulator